MQITKGLRIVSTLTSQSVIKCGKYKLNYADRTLIMGILNVNPDSFSDGGKYYDVDKAVAHAEEMVKQGADIIDIGGESTRPGYTRISDEEEIKRIVPVISEVAKRVEVPISVDTYKSEVAKHALEAGAHIINDIWGVKADPKMAQVAADYNVPIILMHNRHEPNYTNLITDMISDLKESISIAKAAGVRDDQIILDPGVGFGKTAVHNVEAIQHLDQLTNMGYPVLLATSRKGFIGQIVDAPPTERMEGTAATVYAGIAQGVQIVRVHDVLEIKRFVKMADVLVGKHAFQF